MTPDACCCPGRGLGPPHAGRPAISRRALWCGGLGLAAAGMPAAARTSQADGFALDPVAPGAWVHFGQVALVTPANAGDIANLGVVVGERAVAVIDSGGSVTVGAALRAAIRAVTDVPVRYVINTHEHPDHVFGNAAFADATFVGHHLLPAVLAERGPYYLHAYRDQLGPQEIANVRIIPPSVLVQDEATLDLGGRVLRLRAAPSPAHSHCDLAVLDTTTGTLFAGDLLFVRHVPVLDGSLVGWLGLLARLSATPALRAVPGHGRQVVSWPAGLADERRYLTTLAADARRLIAAGVPLAQAAAQIDQAEHGRWQLFDDYNPRNATAAYGELEWE